MQKRALLLLAWAVAIPVLALCLIVAGVLVMVSLPKALSTKNTNCIIYAFSKWAEMGGYVAIRKSRFGWFPHFLWVKDIDGKEMSHIGPVSGLPPKHPLELIRFNAFIKTEDK